MLNRILRIRSLWRNKRTLHIAAMAVIGFATGALVTRNASTQAAPGWLGLMISQWIFVVISAVALISACVIRWSRERFIVWDKKGVRHSRMAFTMLLFITAILSFLMGFKLMHTLSPGQIFSFRRILDIPNTQLWNATAWAWFLLPDLLELAFCYWLLIPERIWGTWVFLLNRDLPPKEGQRWTTFSFSCKRTIERNVYMRATNRYPAQWKLGECFQYFLGWYNRQNPRDPIVYISDEDFERPYRWIFIKQGRWRKRVLDPDRSLLENNVGDNSIILVERVKDYIPAPQKPYLLESLTQPNA